MLRPIANIISSQKPNLLLRTLSAKAKSPKPSKKSATIGNVKGLSDNCVKVPSQPVGPGAAKNKDYKNPEYFCYHVDSFGEAEVEIAPYRLPAPSNKIPFKQ
ncbi:NADH:ubiquinone oxidoreductase subunit V3 isoform X2 [Megalopta genalis]|uniref:NADH:ubiquinone oxidoreductase subunit V3 isoform X2 n=1 Tax=Megalopta genalis TaxID=115081 RepID=UPI003FD2AD8A